MQEALTNITRHAHARHVTVRLGYHDSVDIEVLDDGIGGSAHTGNGILGMRERAVALGGSVDAGPRHGGGFRVSAHLPGAADVITVVIADDQALVRPDSVPCSTPQPDIDGRRRGSRRRRGTAPGARAEARRDADGHPHARRRRARRPRGGSPTTERLADVKVIILTTFDLDEYVFEAIRAGANGFLVKDTEPVELLRAVRAVMAGDALLSPRVTRRLIEEFASRAKDPAGLPDLDTLTDREREVVALVAGGLNNDEIANV